jgi:hypothetical protein
MKKKNKNEIREKILRGLEIYQEKLIQTKKNRNLDLVVSDTEGRVVRIPAHEL